MWFRWSCRGTIILLIHLTMFREMERGGLLKTRVMVEKEANLLKNRREGATNHMRLVKKQ